MNNNEYEFCLDCQCPWDAEEAEKHDPETLMTCLKNEWVVKSSESDGSPVYVTTEKGVRMIDEFAEDQLDSMMHENHFW